MSALDVRTADWHAERQKGIGASDVPAIAGLSPYAKPIDVWQSKVGLTEPSEDTPLLRWGRLLEPIIAEEAERVTGRKFRRLSRAVRYRDWSVLFAHLDRTSADAVLECKSSMTTKGWGDSGSTEIPDHVALQVQAQLAAADKELAIVAALIGYRDFRVYEIPRDRALFDDAILPLLREFWTLVETNVPPEPDGSDSYNSFVRRRFPTDAGTERAATPEEQLVGLSLVEARGARIAAQIKEEELVQRLQTAMGETTKLDGPGWHVTWRQSKDSQRTNWQAVADGYLGVIDALPPEALGALPPPVQVIALEPRLLQSVQTETRPGARPFRFVVTAKEEGDD